MRKAICWADSTKPGLFSSTSACSGVLVFSRLGWQTSREPASKISILSGGEVRLRKV